jgi:F0F1-type ATP synthase delta subunit
MEHFAGITQSIFGIGGKMNDKQLLEEVRKAFSVANDAKRQRQFENSLHFTSMMLRIEKELMTFLQNNIKDNTDEQPTVD